MAEIAKTRYITRRVTLEDGFDAQDLKVMLNAYKTKRYRYQGLLSCSQCR